MRNDNKHMKMDRRNVLCDPLCKGNWGICAQLLLLSFAFIRHYYLELGGGRRIVDVPGVTIYMLS